MKIQPGNISDKDLILMIIKQKGSCVSPNHIYCTSVGTEIYCPLYTICPHLDKIPLSIVYSYAFSKGYVTEEEAFEVLL